MKKINFISSLSVHKQYELRYWFWGTILLWFVSFIIGMTFILPQLIEYISLKKEINLLREKTKSYCELSQKKDTLNNEYTVLSQHVIQIQRYINQPKNPYRYATVIFEISGNEVKIEVLKFNKKDIEITMVCSTSEHATIFIKRLSALDLFTDLKLISLQNDAQINQLRAIVKGAVIF